MELPCPRILFLSVVQCLDVTFLLLIQCGDIEVNPGPPKDSQSKQLDTMLQLLQELNSRSSAFEKLSLS